MNSSSIDHFVVDTLGLKRVGEAKTADHDVGPVRATAVKLILDVLALAEPHARRQKVQFRRQMLTVR